MDTVRTANQKNRLLQFLTKSGFRVYIPVESEAVNFTVLPASRSISTDDIVRTRGIMGALNLPPAPHSPDNKEI